MSDELKIEKAKIDDLMDVFELANDPEVRSSSLNQEKILLENHRNWFIKSISDSKCFFYIFRESKSHDFVGSVRFNEIDKESFLISLQVVKKYRGKGFGKAATEKCIKILASENPISSKIIAHIKENNPASQKTFLKLGFKQIGSGSKNGAKYDIFEKSL